MGPRSHQMELLFRIAFVAIGVGLALPAYPRVVARLAAGGIELSWFGSVGVFALVVAAWPAGVWIAGIGIGVVVRLMGHFGRRRDAGR